jgi:hypothetical protein
MAKYSNLSLYLKDQQTQLFCFHAANIVHMQALHVSDAAKLFSFCSKNMSAQLTEILGDESS